MNRQPQLIIFDLDGTLIDSVPDIAYCIDEMLNILGRLPHGATKVRQWIGNGVERLVRRALVGAMLGEPSDTDFARAYPIFLELYAKHNGQNSTVYPGVREGLTILKSWNYPLACVTNKAARFTEPLLRTLKLHDFFDLVISGDTLATAKPNPAPLLHVATHFGVAPKLSLMVGDSFNDVLAARAAGLPVICVSYGYNHGQDIRQAQPDAVIDSIVDLTNILITYTQTC